MHNSRLALFFLLLTSLCASQYWVNSTGAVNATGGYITPINFFINQTSDRWFFFYGSSSAGYLSNQTLALNSSYLNDSSDNTRLLSLGSTYQYYLISSVPNPFNDTFAVPDLSGLDTYYDLFGLSVSSMLFNDTADYHLPAFSHESQGATLTLPTTYLPGYYDNGSSNPNAFYEGVTQVNSSYLFVVPVNPGHGFDNRTFDYQFVLPYSILSTNTFYIFSIVGPANSSNPHNTNVPLQVPYRWSFSNPTLTIFTVSGASVILHDQLGKAYDAVAGNNGQAQFSLPLGWYSLYISASGYQSITDNLYLQAPFIPTAPVNPNPNNNPFGSTPKNDNLNVYQTPQGLVLCEGSDCFLSPGNLSLASLTELSCTGSICRLTAGNITFFLQKYKFQKTGHVTVPNELAPPAPFPSITEMLSQFGPALSAELGGVDATANKPLFIALLLCVSSVALGLTLLYRPAVPNGPGGPKRRGGYG